MSIYQILHLSILISTTDWLIGWQSYSHKYNFYKNSQNKSVCKQ